MRPFEPLFRHPHAATIAANFWPRGGSEREYPVTDSLHETEPGVRVLVQSQEPHGLPRGHLVLVHGLEGSSRAGYMRSLARRALAAGFAVHRLNLRSCGGTEALSRTLYHAGLTTDLRALLESLRSRGLGPRYAAGFSLGGNVVFKLAGELGGQGGGLLAAVCGVSVPIDLEACAHALARRENRLYEWRFLRLMKRRFLRHLERHPGPFRAADVARVTRLRDFDGRFTAPSFGFRDASEYYGTQSSQLYLNRIRVPALLIHALDDPLVPAGIFDHPAFGQNPCLERRMTAHGGHLGFLARRRPRFWADEAAVEWFEGRDGTQTADSGSSSWPAA